MQGIRPAKRLLTEDAVDLNLDEIKECILDIDAMQNDSCNPIITQAMINRLKLII